jgi:hypothetical protein
MSKVDMSIRILKGFTRKGGIYKIRGSSKDMWQKAVNELEN